MKSMGNDVALELEYKLLMTVSNIFHKQTPNPLISFLGPWFNICLRDWIWSSQLAIHFPERDCCKWHEGDNTQGSGSSKHASPCQHRLCKSQRFWISTQSSPPNPGCKAHFKKIFHEQFMFRCSTCTRVICIHLPRTQSQEPSTFLNPWLQPRSSWTRWMGPLALLFKSSSLEWTRLPKKGISANLLKAGRFSKVRPHISLSTGSDLFRSETISFSLGPDWLTDFYDNQFGLIDGDTRNNRRPIENILDSGKIFLDAIMGI